MSVLVVPCCGYSLKKIVLSKKMEVKMCGFLI